MKSIIKLKVTGIDYYTLKKVSFKKTITAPDINFVDQSMPELAVNKGKNFLPSYTNTAFMQADEWISNQTDFLNNLIYNVSRELKCIVDWDIISIKNFNDNQETTLPLNTNIIVKPKLKESDAVILFLQLVDKESDEPLTDEFKANFMHTFMHMGESLKGLKFDKKISITLKAMNVGITAATVAYQRMLDVFKKYDAMRESGKPLKKISKSKKQEKIC